MKKINLLFHLICLSISFLAAQAEPSISISIKSSIEKEQNILGLSMLQLEIVNHCDSAVKIHNIDHLFFEANWKEHPNGLSFSERDVVTSNGPGTQILKAHETLKLTVNLNLFDLANIYFVETGKIFESARNVSVRAGIYSRTGRQYCYSDTFQIDINPFTQTDLEAFAFIRENGQDPYQFTGTGKITAFGIDQNIAYEVMVKYPESTFAELASLSRAYQNAKDIRIRPELRTTVQGQLKKPLASRYSFVRYLAEELKKRVN